MVAARDGETCERLSWWANATGVGAGAFDAFLAARGLRTLPVRAKAQSETALILAKRLAGMPGVKHVDYPGLETHPGHEIAVRQQDGFGPLLSLELEGGTVRAAKFVKSLALFTLAQSLGGVESLASIPALMTHSAMSPQARKRAGIADALVRLSVGLEDGEDLARDLERALELSASG